MQSADLSFPRLGQSPSNYTLPGHAFPAKACRGFSRQSLITYGAYLNVSHAECRYATERVFYYANPQPHTPTQVRDTITKTFNLLEALTYLQVLGAADCIDDFPKRRKTHSRKRPPVLVHPLPTSTFRQCADQSFCRCAPLASDIARSLCYTRVRALIRPMSSRSRRRLIIELHCWFLHWPLHPAVEEKWKKSQ